MDPLCDRLCVWLAVSLCSCRTNDGRHHNHPQSTQAHNRQHSKETLSATSSSDCCFSPEPPMFSLPCYFVNKLITEAVVSSAPLLTLYLFDWSITKVSDMHTHCINTCRHAVVSLQVAHSIHIRSCMVLSLVLLTIFVVVQPNQRYIVDKACCFAFSPCAGPRGSLCELDVCPE